MPIENAKPDAADSKDDLTSRLLKRFSSDNPYYLLDEMTIAVNAQKEHAAKKGIIFNCCVLSCTEDNFNDLTNFLRNLEQNKNGFPNTTRIQYLLRYGESNSVKTLHWTTADIQIKNGNLTFYLLDPAELLDGLLLQLLLIHTICPGAEVFYTNLKIQKDIENCGSFSLVLALGLAKITHLHQLLAFMYAPIQQRLSTLSSAVSYGQSLLNQIDNETFYDDHNEVEVFYSLLNTTQVNHLTRALQKLKHIPRNALLQQAEFGSLFKNNQDQTLDTHAVKCRNTKPLNVFIQENSGEYTKDGKLKYGNLAIMKKSKKINERCSSYVASNQEQCDILITNRLHFHFFNASNPTTNNHTKPVERTQDDTDSRKKLKTSAPFS